jgi:hypothetical protein
VSSNKIQNNFGLQSINYTFSRASSQHFSAIQNKSISKLCESETAASKIRTSESDTEYFETIRRGDLLSTPVLTCSVIFGLIFEFQQTRITSYYEMGANHTTV